MIASYDAIFTNPNKSKVFIGKEVLDAAKSLKVICTASTGTNHIDKDYASELGLPILALTKKGKLFHVLAAPQQSLLFG